MRSWWDIARGGGRLRPLVVLMIAGALGATGQALAMGGQSKAAVSCTGAFAGTAQALIVPAGAVCTLEATAHIVKNVEVAPTGSLIDEGATIGGSLRADKPVGIQIGGPQLSAIKKNVEILGLTGHLSGDNFVCNAKVGGNLTDDEAAASAGPVVIGDAPVCSAGDHVSKSLRLRGNETEVDVSSSGIGQSLDVEGNTAGVTVSANKVSQNLTVQGNSGGVTVRDNSAGRTATCSDNMPSTEGEGNTAHRGNSCPTSPSPPVVKRVSPDRGSGAGGTAVTITGRSFTGALEVKFGSMPVSFVPISDTEITTTSPAGAGTVDVTVTTAAGPSEVTSADRFKYQFP
jgi:IPT/TIG domain